MKRRVLVASTAFAALGIFAGGATFFEEKPSQTPPPPPATQEGGSLERMHSPVFGPAAASVTIVEFFDPSCEACRAFYPIVKQLLAQTGDDVRLVLRYTPLHEGSEEVVRILEAARRQDLFQPVLEALLANQPEWAVHGAPEIEKAWQVAAGAGLELEKARRDAVSDAVNTVLALDVADVQANNIRQTPTFFVNGKPLTDFSPKGLYDQVKTELDASTAGSKTNGT
tara:strand:+ start:210 stop:887 length:678 start_codon:yes stop_codon:yes gene_type:complete